MKSIEVIAASPLSELSKKKLETFFRKKSGVDCEFSYTTDASLLGGVLVREGDNVYDGSVRTQLGKLRSSLL